MHALESAISAKIPGRPRFADEVRGFVDERFRDRGEDEHWLSNDTVRPSMRVWIDLTNSPHVLVMRPVIELLRADGHDVRVTARDFAQTIELCERFGIAHTAIGRHRGERLARQGRRAWRRARRRSCAGRARTRARPAAARFDLALGHGSNDVSVAAALLRIPSATMFDYEWATVQHNVNCRLARAVVVPDAIPRAAPGALRRAGQGAHATRASRRSTTWRTSSPTTACSEQLGLDPARAIVVVRTPPRSSLYHRFENDLFAQVLARLRSAAAEQGVQPVVLPRVASQREELRRVPGFVVPEQAIDAQSLIAHADLVISAGGTMNREAVALGTPVYTTFQGRLGAVDERLIAEGRMRMLADGGRARARQARARAPASAPPARACAAIRACWSICCSRRSACAPSERRLRRRGRGRRIQSQQCADGSARRPFPSTVTRCRSSQWTGRWSRSHTTSPSSCASTAARPVQYAHLREDTIWWVLAREPAGAGALARLPAPLALRRPARLRGDRAGGGR